MIQSALLKTWSLFIWERFPPLTYIPFLALYVIAHYVFTIEKHTFPIENLMSLYIVTVVFFFKLRLYDEIKDYESDKLFHPERPVARGLLSRSDVIKAIVICSIVELGIFSFYGTYGVFAISLPIVYSLFMFKEFFIKDWLRAHLTSYAVTHTLVSSLFSVALLSVFQTKALWDLDIHSYLFALVSWSLFTIFEFGRKTFLTSEEKKTRDSYSKIYGRSGASMLVIILASCTLLLLSLLPETTYAIPFISLYILLLSLSALLFTKKNKQPFGTRYRTIAFFFIAFVYLSFIISTIFS